MEKIFEEKKKEEQKLVAAYQCRFEEMDRGIMATCETTGSIPPELLAKTFASVTKELVTKKDFAITALLLVEELGEINNVMGAFTEMMKDNIKKRFKKAKNFSSIKDEDLSKAISLLVDEE